MVDIIYELHNLQRMLRKMRVASPSNPLQYPINIRELNNDLLAVKYFNKETVNAAIPSEIRWGFVYFYMCHLFVYVDIFAFTQLI